MQFKETVWVLPSRWPASRIQLVLLSSTRDFSLLPDLHRSICLRHAANFHRQTRRLRRRMRLSLGRLGDRKNTGPHPCFLRAFDENCIATKRNQVKPPKRTREELAAATAPDVMEGIRTFLALALRTVQEGHSFTKTWKPGGPWR